MRTSVCIVVSRVIVDGRGALVVPAAIVCSGVHRETGSNCSQSYGFVHLAPGGEAVCWAEVARGTLTVTGGASGRTHASPM